MAPVDDLVYALPDGTHYLAQFDGVWYRWPAEEHGWAQRAKAKADDAAPDRALAPRFARLALRLSGVDR